MILSLTAFLLHENSFPRQSSPLTFKVTKQQCGKTVTYIPVCCYSFTHDKYNYLKTKKLTIEKFKLPKNNVGDNCIFIQHFF